MLCCSISADRSPFTRYRKDEPKEEFFRFWSEAKCAHDFTCGKCTPEQFAWHKFLAEFRTWLRGPYDGALDLLQGLRPRYRVACLTGFGDLMIQLNEIKISS